MCSILLNFFRINERKPTYESYYKQVDPTNVGIVATVSAARFFKKFGLIDVILSRVSEKKNIDTM